MKYFAEEKILKDEQGGRPPHYRRISMCGTYYYGSVWHHFSSFLISKGVAPVCTTPSFGRQETPDIRTCETRTDSLFHLTFDHPCQDLKVGLLRILAVFTD